jgi:hypothetical protein
LNRAASANYAQTLSNAGEIEQLNKKVKQIQGSNLINAQNVWFNDNNARLNGGVAQVGQGFSLNAGDGQSQVLSQQANPNDAELDVAGRQWEKLEAAQQLAVAKVTPLHVTLPTRGVRYVFTQVLQTEINKPMTVALTAANTKATNWLGRIALSAGGFLLLWALTALVAGRREA